MTPFSRATWTRSARARAEDGRRKEWSTDSVGGLDGRAVRYGVRERHSEFNDVLKGRACVSDRAWKGATKGD